jgi:hypothetical protein
MADSLVLGNLIELMGGGVISQIPACAGAMFKIDYAPGMDLGAGQPTSDYVASLLLDGERPFGRRASNRTVVLPVQITTPGVAGTAQRQLLAAAREVLAQVIDQDVWTLTWTRDPGAGTRLPLLLDCFRAQPSKPVYDPLSEQHGGVMRITLTIPALPYGRSDTQFTPAFTGAVPQTPTPPPPPAPVTLDTYATISGPQFSQSTQCVVGPFTALWDPDSFGDPGGQVTPLSYTAKFTTPLNLASMASLQFWFGLGSRYYPQLEYPGRIHGTGIAITLTDTSGATLSLSRDYLRMSVTPVAQAPVFSRISVPFPAFNPLFSYNAVASYTLTITNRQDRGISRLSWVTAYLDSLTAQPSTQTVTPVTRGNLYTLYGLLGTARAPVSMSFQQPPSPGTPTTITATGAGNYTVPAATAWLKVETWGAGGAGASRTTAGDGGGGGGGEYAREDIFPAQAGQVVPYNVGPGGTPGAAPADGGGTTFGPGPAGSLVVQANGGKSAAQNSITGGAAGGGSVNSVSNPGGAGRTASGSVGGGGGSSGGTGSPGQSPMGTAAVLFTAAGTDSWVCPAGVTQVLAECWGAGGSGGSGGVSTNGAGGGGGEYAAALVAVTPGNTYAPVVGAGGAGTSSGNSSGNAGASSVFAGDSVTVTAHGGQAGHAAFSGGNGAGGTGSSSSTHFDGGQGGSAYPYSGGGGSSAGSATRGNAGNGYGSPGSPPADGGGGGAGSGVSSSAGTAGQAPGGGGGGTFSSVDSGAGAAGRVRLTYPGGSPTNNGAAAVAGGGAGGAGGASGNTTGSAGSQPGGGGGGADMSTVSQAGGAGGAGQIIITPFASAPFKNLIAHRPPLGAVKTFQPLVSVGGGSDAPDGTHEYRMPQPVTGLNADFGGTYTIYLIASSLSGSGTRTITLTVNQYEYSGGPKYSVSTLPVTVTPAQITNGVITAGVLTLPVKAVAPDNTGSYYTVTPLDTSTSDRFSDCVFLDTQGQTVVVNEPTTGYINYFIDEPQPNLSLGYILGSNGGRPDAISVLDNSLVSGGPLAVEPADGDNQLFAYSADGSAPVIAVSYYPRWFYDRFQ